MSALDELRQLTIGSVAASFGHLGEAAAFVRFLANDEEAAKVLLTERGVPADRRIRAAIAGQLEETDRAAKGNLDTVPVGDPPTITPNGAGTVDAILERHSEDLLFGRTTPEKAAAFIEEVQSEVDAAK